MLDSLLDRGDAAGVGALDDVFDFFGKRDALFLDQLAAFDNVDGDVRIDESDDIQINAVGVCLDLENIFFAHGVAAGIFDDGNSAVQLVEFQIMVDQHALACLDMVEHDSVFNFSYIQHVILLF